MSNTKLNKSQTGDGIWTSDNLLAGNNLSFTLPPNQRTKYDVSNLSSENIILLPKAQRNADPECTYIVKFTTSDDITSNQTIIHSETFCAFAVQDERFTTYNYRQGQTLWVSGMVHPNTTYWIKLVNNYTHRYWYFSTDGTNYDQIFDFTDNVGWGNYTYNIYLGCHTQLADRPFKGTIHLNDVIINHNGTITFNGNTAMEGKDFLILGHPTIDTDSNLVTSLDIDLTSVSGYNASNTQVLKNINGTLTWVDEA